MRRNTRRKTQAPTRTWLNGKRNESLQSSERDSHGEQPITRRQGPKRTERGHSCPQQLPNAQRLRKFRLSRLVAADESALTHFAWQVRSVPCHSGHAHLLR